MASLPCGRKVTVKWNLFKSIAESALADSWDPWRSSVYVIGDPQGRPLYVGKATGEAYPGFGDRYSGNRQAMEAWGHGTRNRLYIGRIRGARRPWYADLERELIARESMATRRHRPRKPRYNTNHKDTDPDDEIQLRHTGNRPAFYHLD